MTLWIRYEDSSERGENTSGWAFLPEMVLEEVFSVLPLRYKFSAGLTCRNWFDVFQSDKTWETYIYRDYTFTRNKFTLHAGWQPVTDHWKLRFLVRNAARRWRHLIVKPVNLLHNLYEFLRVITNFTEYYEQMNDNPLRNIRSFEFDWEMEFHVREARGVKETVLGTGGEMLKTVSNLLHHLDGLELLALRQLQLSTNEADDFMDELLEKFGPTLSSLCILNLTKTEHSFMHLGLFLNLRKLVVSPQHLNDDVVTLIASNCKLRILTLVQDQNTKGSRPVSGATWKEATSMSPKLRVHLRIRGRVKDDVIWQPNAPVTSVVYDSPFARLTVQNAWKIIDNYANTLETYVQRGLQRRFRSKVFEDRADEALIMLVRNCHRLKLLAVRERLSTATVLLTAHLCAFRDTFFFRVRRNALLKRCDWPHNPKEWSRDFYTWLRVTSRDYELTDAAVSTLLGKTWTASTDNEYMRLFQKPLQSLFH